MSVDEEFCEVFKKYFGADEDEENDDDSFDDVKERLKNYPTQKKKVLLFPPVNNYRRFLIHQTCEHFRNKYDLFTFSVGQGASRRTVVCFKNQLLDPHKYSDTSPAAHLEVRYKYTTSNQLRSWRKDNRRFELVKSGKVANRRDKKMGVENNVLDANKINKSNSEDLYRPPALRTNGKETYERRNIAEKNELTTNTGSLNIERNQTTSSEEANSLAATATSLSCNNSPIHRNENGNMKNLAASTQQSPIRKSQQQQLKYPQQPQRQSQARRERRPDRAVYIPRARRSQTTPPNTLITQLQTIPQEEEKQTRQLPALAPKTTSVTSKSINQQLAFALDDDTPNVSVNKQPSNESHEVRKVNSDSSCCNSNCSRNTTITTAIKKKEKLIKENKDAREVQREQRLLRKLPSISTERNETNKNLNESPINTISKDTTNQELFGNAQQMQCSVPRNNVNNFSEVNDDINLPKDINCDSSEVFVSDQEQQVSTNSKTISELQFLETSQAHATNVVVSSESEFLYRSDPRIETTCNISALHNAATKKITIDLINIDTMPKPSTKIETNNSEMLNQTQLPHLRIEDIASQQSHTKCDVEDQELLRASKEINRSNRRIIKQTFNSDVLQIPDHVNHENEHKSKLVKSTNKSLTNTDEEEDEEEEEDDWENMYDDSGDCLDPKVMQELTAAVGKCKIELPKMDYSTYLTKQSILNEEEFPHVLEVSNFPVEFKNQDLLMVFSQYKESGFDIKWVDDTHALAVFSSSRIAAEVLTLGHPFVVLKPLAEATLESRLKAKKCAASLQPYRPRPETCAALARRLVTGALGVRLKTAAAERENEKRVLREAKERKLLAAKQRDEIWES